ncbi:oxidoreductase-like domain-containing protein [Metallibacterium sp.]
MFGEESPQSRAPRPQPPSAPEPGDCCGGGCTLCIFDLHEQALQRYQQQLAAGV